jgi:hypothetical protein
MKFIRPTPVTDAVLLSSNVPETDYAAWAAATNYAVGAKVIRTSTHSIYERVVAGTTATPPESDAVNWTYYGPTNKWAMFDEKVGTVTTRADSISVTLKPGRANGLGLLNVSAAQVSVSVVMAGETVYEATMDLTNGTRVGSWYAYFYEPIYSATELVVTDLLDAALMSLPAAGDAEITVTLSRPGGTVSCGMLVVGRVFEVGTTTWSPSVGIRDFSSKERDRFGNVSLKEGDYARLMSATVEVPAALADTVANNVSRYRARNVLWIGAKQYGSLVVYGFLSDWKLVHRDEFASIFNMEVEGMT